MILICIVHLDYNLKLPPWLCQPYVRHLPEENIQKLEIEKIEKVSLILKRIVYKDIFFSFSFPYYV